MLKHLLLPDNQDKVISYRYIVRLFLLAIFASLTLAAAGPAAAQEGTTVYLPLIFSSGHNNPPPASPYAEMLEEVLAVCQPTGPNQLCYGQGQVNLATGPAFTQPGQLIDLAAGQSLDLVSTGADRQTWSAVLLRLQAHAATPDQSLTILAFGNIQLTDLALFTGGAGLDDSGLTLPSLQFTSNPVAGGPAAASGLLVYNPAESELLSLTINGAAVTLDGSLFGQAEPGGVLSLTVAEGSVLVDAFEENEIAPQEMRIDVPLDGNGAVAGPPTAASRPAEDLLAPLRPAASTTAGQVSVSDDLLAPLVPPRRLTDQEIFDLLEWIILGEEVALDRCQHHGDARQVYRFFYYARLAQLSTLSGDYLAELGEKLRKCATFELEFDSTITGAGPMSWVNRLNSQGVRLQFGVFGQLLTQNPSAPITHLNFEATGLELPGCARHYVVADGLLTVPFASMRISGNSLRIRTHFWPEVPQEIVRDVCPPPQPTSETPLPWITMFHQFHQNKFNPQTLTYNFREWSYNGGVNFAETIHTGETAAWPGPTTLTSDFYMILVHTPEP